MTEYVDLIAVILFLGGAGLYAVHLTRFQVPQEHIAIVPSKSKMYGEGWNWGLLPGAGAKLIQIEPKTITIPNSDFWIEIETPDEGVLGVRVSVSYAPDSSSVKSLNVFQNSNDIMQRLDSRIRSALRDWMWQKPKPGALKRAMASKSDAEQAVLSKITSLPTDTLARFSDTDSFNRYSVNDLGIVIREVHITDMTDLEHGTGKPSWGDDDELLFDAEKVRLRLRQRVSNISELRSEKAKLIADFPDEEDSIENLYDEERIRLMEHRDR